MGRWTAVDPRGQHYDAYLYGSNNPVNRFDPDGGTDYPSVNMDLSSFTSFLWKKPGEEWAGYKQAAPGAAKDIGKAALITAGVATALVPGTGPLLMKGGQVLADATVTAGRAIYLTAAKNPAAVVAASQIVTGAVDPNPPENPLQAVGQGIGMALGKVFESISSFFSSSPSSQTSASE